METNNKFEYEIKPLDHNALEFLRENTKLGPIASLKVQKARKDAYEYRDLYMKYEPNDLIEVDFSTADELEYQLRFKAWEKSLERNWKQYGDGLGLSEFAEIVLQQHLASEELGNKKR